MASLINPGEATGTPPANPRPVGDVFCPFFKLSFTNQLGATGTITRMVASDDVGTIRVPAQPTDEEQILDSVIKAAASMTVETIAGSPLKFTLDLTPTYEDGVRILASQIISYLTIVTANWGYVTSTGAEVLAGNHHFRVMEPKASFGEDMRITVVGYDLTSDANMRNTSLRQWDRTTYPRDLDILATLCSYSGYTLKADPSLLTTSVNRVIEAKTPAGDTNALEQFSTDWQFFKSICRMHGVTFAILSGSEVLLFDPFAPPPDAEKLTYTFKWRKKLEGAYDVPVYNIAGTILPSAFLPPSGPGVLSITVDNTTGDTTFKVRDGQNVSETREVVAGPLTPENQAAINSITGGQAIDTAVPGGKTINPGPIRGTDQTGTFLSVQDRAERASQADNLVKEAAFFSNPKVKIRCPGVVDIYPGRLVKVEGTGKIYDYTYSVFAVKHMLGNNGYDMEVDLIRQGSSTAKNAVMAPPVVIRPISPAADSSTVVAPADADAAPPIVRRVS